MKLELRENMYVRTKDGIIDKILKLNKSYVKGVSQKDELYAYDIDNIVKASNNIIDLIEVGDFVNGNEVMEADWINENGEYEEGLAFPMYASDDLDVIENWLPLRCVDIKSIVTKEQFEQMVYKVEE